jgi:DNA-binding CsgD family transcriptional regulator
MERAILQLLYNHPQLSKTEASVLHTLRKRSTAYYENFDYIHISRNSLKATICSLRKKMDLDIQCEREIGYRLHD